MMAISQEEHYLLSKRDEAERHRLNVQSKVIKALRENHILEPHIPKENIRNVADIATGTGVWMADVAAELEEAGNSEVNLVGFDISDEVFPKRAPKNTKFVLADIHKGFAKEWHGVFDVVHLRLLIVVLTIDQIEPAVRNVLKLIKPGGYLQWDDLNYDKDPDTIYPPGNDNTSFNGEIRNLLSFKVSQGWSLNIVGNVGDVLKSCSVDEVRTREYYDDCYTRPELQPLLAEWARSTFPVLFHPIMLRKGKSAVEAEAYAKNSVRKIVELERRGGVAPLPLVSLTARRTAFV